MRTAKGQFVKTHGYWVGNRKHFLWEKWRSMRRRCFDPKNKDFGNYGGRGITVCQRWLDFGNFVADLLPTWTAGMTLGRIDNDGPYSPENCRWEGLDQQNNNRRDNVLIEFHGIIQTASEWQRSCGINKSTFWSRMRSGLPMEKVINPRTAPPKTIKFNGKNQTVSEWANEIGVKRTTISSRLRYGFPTEKVLYSGVFK